MENTSCGEKCCFVKTGFCDNETECPNYIETIWEDKKNGKMVTVKDCSPRRTMLEQQRIGNYIMSVSNQVSTLKSQVNSLEESFNHIVRQTQEFILEVQNTNKKQIELDKDGKD